MVRLIAVIILSIGGLAAQTNAPAPNDRDSASPASAVEPGTTPPQPAVSSTKTDFPLDAFTEFSAVMVGSIMEPGEGTSEAYIYRSGPLMRMEGPEGHGYFITNVSTLETYGISASPCVHDTHPFFRASPFVAARPDSTVERKASGQETLDGHACRVEEVTVSSPKAGKPLKMKLWEAEDLQGFPIRIDFERAGGNHSTVRYKNVVLGPQDPTLFIYPRTCEAMPQKDRPKTSSTPAKTGKPAASAAPK